MDKEYTDRGKGQKYADTLQSLYEVLLILHYQHILKYKPFAAYCYVPT